MWKLWYDRESRTKYMPTTAFNHLSRLSILKQQVLVHLNSDQSTSHATHYYSLKEWGVDGKHASDNNEFGGQ